MNYEKFIEGIMWTKKEWACMERNLHLNLPKEFHYENLRNRGDDYWLHLERMTETELAKEIINRFLNTREWMVRLNKPSSPKGKEIVMNLKKAVDQLPEPYTALKGLNIVDSDLLGTSLIVIGGIYVTYCDIKPKFGPVAASKLMHMALPNLFVMWDDAIISGYHVPSYPSDKPQYLPFLILMQENARHIKETCPAGSNVDSQDFLKRINTECGYKGLPMTRLLDIANYAVGHQSDKPAPNIRCKECCERTNARLPEVETAIRQYTRSDFKLGRFKW